VRCVEVMCAGVPHTSAHKGIYYGEGQVVQSLREGCVPHTLRRAPRGNVRNSSDS
jgi:hypothetical protein